MKFGKTLDSQWPTREQKLLLRAALLQGEAALEAWQHWQEAVDIEDHDAESYHLFPLVYRNLSAHEVADSVMVRLKGVYRRQWCENQLLFSKFAPIFQSLQNAGIKTLLLNDAALAAYYPDNGCRYLPHLDILVPTTDARLAINFLETMGFTPNAALSDQLLSVYQGLGFKDRAKQPLNLYWHLFSTCFQDRADDEFWQAAVSTQLGEVSTYILNPTDQLLSLCVQVYSWNKVSPILWLTDAMMILNSCGGEIDWERLIDRAQKYQLILPLSTMLCQLQEILNPPIPSSTLAKIQTIKVSLFEQLEYQVKTSKAIPVIGALLVRYFQYLRSVNTANVPFKFLGFAKYLQYVWELEHLGQVPAQAAMRVMSRMRRELLRAFSTNKG